MFNNIKASKINEKRAIARIWFFSILATILLSLAIIFRENYLSDAILFGSYLMIAAIATNVAILVSIIRRMRIVKKYGVD